MKKGLKVALLIACAIFGLLIFLILSFNVMVMGVKLDKDKFINFQNSIVFYYEDGQQIKELSNGKVITDIFSLPTHLKNAFVAVEDKRFYQHKGVDYKGLLRAFFSNLKTFSFKEGASTITQQLIKNTHLSSEKTIKRKLSEIKLALELEKNFSKDTILEKYLNTIYFGGGCYGITNASAHYFNKSPSDLDINESATLASIIKAPSIYSPFINYEKCMQRKDTVLSQMLSQKLISNTEFSKYYKKSVTLSNENANFNGYDYVSMAQNELNEIIKNAPYSSSCLKVYTYCNKNAQENLTFNLKNNKLNSNFASVLIGKNGAIKAHFSTCGNTKRQLGSVFKPLVSYAPAIENNLVHSATKLLDKQTNFNGYCPKNFGEKYQGEISVKDSLCASSNVCAVKLLNYVGVEKAKGYLNKLNIPLLPNDNSLSLALGAIENGVSLTEITGAYSVFNSLGYYTKPSYIEKIIDINGNIIYKNTAKQTQVFGGDTVSIINDILENTVKNGTARKLNSAKTKLYAKTGTVGNSVGNTDAYTISYNNDLILGTWVGNKANKLLDNSVTGGGITARLSLAIWDGIYKNAYNYGEIPPSDDVSEVYIDKIAYDNNGEIILADNIAPLNRKIKILVKNNNMPKCLSTRFSSPVIETPQISVNNKEISILLCLPQYYDAKVFREENGKKTLVYDTKNKNKNIFIDKTVKENTFYTYSVIPYYENIDNIYYGKEIKLKKIKSSTINVDDEWWND